tara:strand:+ start:73454 stop:74407 length:954 start_codon:yes stop_codon:yes gene_type:complete
MNEYLTRIVPRLAVIGVFAAIVTSAPPLAGAALASDETAITTRTTLTIGRVSGNPRKHAGRLMAFGEYLLSRLDGYGLSGTEVVLNANPQNILDSSVRGEIDLMSETVFTAMRLESTDAMEIALLEWKQEIQRYRTALIVRKDSDINALADLRGRTIAFEDRGSTSGFFLPYLEIMEAGINLSPIGTGNPTRGAVRYSFAESEVNVVASVIRGRTDAGAISETDLADPEVMTERFKPQIKVIHLTQWVPRSVLLMRSSMDPALKSRLQEILLEMHLDEAGRRILDRYFKVGRYAVIDSQARDDLARIRDAVRLRHGS